MTEELNPNPAGQAVTETVTEPVAETEIKADPETPVVETEAVKVEAEAPAEKPAVTAPVAEPARPEPAQEGSSYRGREGGSSYSGGGQRGGYYSDREGGGGQSFDQMMKAFRKQSVDIQRKLKKNRFYEKPSVKKRKQRQEAIKKARKNRRFN